MGGSGTDMEPKTSVLWDSGTETGTEIARFWNMEPESSIPLMILGIWVVAQLTLNSSISSQRS